MGLRKHVEVIFDLGYLVGSHGPGQEGGLQDSSSYIVVLSSPSILQVMCPLWHFCQRVIDQSDSGSVSAALKRQDQEFTVSTLQRLCL